MPPSKYEYSFFRITKDGDIACSAENYKRLRLNALSIAPASFSSTYEIESALSDTEWIERLLDPGRQTFICAATPVQIESSAPNPLEKPTWIGQLTLLGPQGPEVFALPPESGQSIPNGDKDKELWQMLSLFTLPEYRGQGLGRRLCQEAMEYLVQCNETPRVICVRLMVKPENQITVRLYQGLGFKEVGKCTLAEALVANGDGALVPDDISEEKYSARTGLIMIREIKRS